MLGGEEGGVERGEVRRQRKEEEGEGKWKEGYDEDIEERKQMARE